MSANNLSDSKMYQPDFDYIIFVNNSLSDLPLALSKPSHMCMIFDN